MASPPTAPTATIRWTGLFPDKGLLMHTQSLLSAQGVVVILICAFACISTATPSSAQQLEDPPAPTRTFSAEVVQATAEGLYVELERDVLLKRGQTGWVMRNGKRLSRVRVRGVTEESSFLVLLTPWQRGFPRAGDWVTLTLDSPVQTKQPEVKPAPSDTLKTGDNPPVPLLDNERWTKPSTGPSNIFYGRLSLRQSMQDSSKGYLDLFSTRLRTTGTVERLEGTPWSLEWSGEFAYRGDNGLNHLSGHDSVRPWIYQLALSRRFDDHSTLIAGRFVPKALPSIGYIDGVHGEKIISPNLRIGGVLGFKPYRDDLNPTFKEPTIVPYLTLTAGEDQRNYSGTVGILASIFDSKFDRAAILMDQIAHYDNVYVSSSSEVDFDAGGGDARDDAARLTRWNLAISQQRDGWSPRIGVDRFEQPDIEAERDLIDDLVLNEEDFIDGGYWRSWIGATHRLSENYSLDETISFVESDYDDALRWTVSLTKRTFIQTPGASATTTLFNLAGSGQEGYGCRLSAYFPFANARASVQPSFSVRYTELDSSGDAFWHGDATLRGNWRVNRDWRLFGVTTYSVSDDDDRLLIELGITMEW